MPEIGFPELILIAIVGLLVIGPDRLPETLRTLGLWLGRMRRSFNTVKAEIEKEIGMDEVKRQLHNEAIMEEMKRIESEVKNTANTARASIDEGVNAAQTSTDDVWTHPKIDPNAQADIAATVAAQDSIQPPASDSVSEADASSEPTDKLADGSPADTAKPGSEADQSRGTTPSEHIERG